MITTFDTYASGAHTYDMIGLSTDEKPTSNIPNASSFYEMDTKKIFFFDAENKVWLEQ